jgi:hypothetical protein
LTASKTRRFGVPSRLAQLDFLLFLAGFPLRFIDAIFFNSVAFIDSYMPFDAPFRDDFAFALFCRQRCSGGHLLLLRFFGHNLLL